MAFCFYLIFLIDEISEFKYSRNLEVTSFYVDFKTRLSSYTRDIELYSATQNNKNCYDVSLEETCIFNPDEEKQIVLLGDSHSIELGKLLSTNIKNYKITILTGNNCLYIFEKQYQDYCKGKDKKQFDSYVSEFSNSTFIYHGNLTSSGYDEIYNLENSLPETFTYLTKNGNNLIVISPNPTFPFNTIDLYGNSKIFGDSISINLKDWQEVETVVWNFVYSNQNLFEFTKFFVIFHQRQCTFGKNFRDNHHLTVEEQNLFIQKFKSY